MSATDADTDDLLRYELLAGEGDSGNHWFVLDANGSLYSSTIFDYETNATQYAIRARALDEANASVEGTFTVSLLNVVEDINGDGNGDYDGDGLLNSFEITNLTDPFKFDTDGDGLWDKIEIETGTDPLSEDSDGDGLTDLADLPLINLPDGKITILDGNDSFEGFLGPDGKLYSILKEIGFGKNLNDFLVREKS